MSSSSTSNPTDQFGPNEWLVEEMYQRFLEDPDSVDPAWHEFFADYRPGDASPTSGNAAQTAADTTAAPSPLTPIEKPGRQAVRREPAAESEPRARGRRAAPARPNRPPRCNGAAAKPAAGTTSQAAARPAERPPSRCRRRGHHPARCGVARGQEHERLAHRAHGHERARRAGEAARRQPGGHQQPAAPHPGRQDQLHAHDRLRRGQGAGRVPGDEPALRRGGRQADGRAARARQPRPGDRPAGQEQGAAHAGRRLDQGLRVAELRPVLVGVRGHRAQGPQRQPHRRRLQGHHDLAHQPRHPGHQPLGPAADAGPGHDRGRRGDGVPRRVPGREPGDPLQDRHQQDHHTDVDLRPPDHPGCGVRRLPAPRARAAARRGRVLRRHLPLAAGALRARAVGAGPARRPGGQGRAGHRDDRRLPHARPPDGRHRPAQLPPAPPPRPRRALPRPHPVGPRPGVRRRRFRGPASG